jgi:anti-sigma regulatory factor (Ser/Thr protein kinase)/PAS domain-containing protein
MLFRRKELNLLQYCILHSQEIPCGASLYGFAPMTLFRRFTSATGLFIKMILTIFIIIILLFSAIPAFSTEEIQINDSIHKFPIGNRCETLEDKSGYLNIYSIISDNYSSSFTRVKSEIPNFGFTKSVYWARFSLYNNSPSELSKFLEVGFPILDRVELYIFSFKNEKPEFIQNIISGRDFPFRNRPVEYKNFVFPFKIHPGERLTFYLKIRTDDGMIFPLTIWNRDYFNNLTRKEYFLFGIYYGIILVMILYNLFLFIFTRDRNYFFYIIYISCFGIFQISMNGLAVQYLWPENTWWGNIANPFFIGLSVTLAGLFSINFLEMKKNIPRFDMAMKILMAMSLILSAVSFFVDYSLCVIAGQLLPVAAILLVIPAAVICLKKGNRSARFYLISWTVFFIGVILSALRVTGFVPHTFITEYGLQIGSGLETVLLSIALADRINIMKKEKDEAQQEVIKSQQVLVENLHRSKQEVEAAHKMLSLSEEKYRLLVEGSSDIIFTLDENFKFINANYAIATELRLNPAMIQGMNFLDLVYKDTREQQVSSLLVREKLDEFLREKQPVNFRVTFISPINTEPKEMLLHLEYINIEGKNEILGKASNVTDDSLLRYFISEKQKYSIGNYLITVDEIVHRITRNLKKYFDAAEIKLMQIALREILINAIEHGNLGLTFAEKSKALSDNTYFEIIRARQMLTENLEKKVYIEYSINSERVVYIISDEGEGFNHDQFQVKAAPGSDEDIPVHGRGITMTRNAFDEVTYNKKGNHVMLIKYIKHQQN